MKLVSDSPQKTRQIGKILAKNLEKNDIICLFGELGCGKTVFTQGVAIGLGIKKGLVSSPSFVIIRKYTGKKLILNHFDLYRLQKTNDILALGYEEYFYEQAATVIEWAQRLKDLLPREYLKIEFFIKGASKRCLAFTAFGRRYEILLSRMQKVFA